MPSPSIASFGPWAEQFLAESTGKQGKGLIPIAGEELRPRETTIGVAALPSVYGDDRLFVQLRVGRR